MNSETYNKVNHLMELLLSLKSVAVGFSAGADSTFLSAAVSKCLGDKAVAITACSATLPLSERNEAVAIAQELGIRH